MTGSNRPGIGQLLSGIVGALVLAAPLAAGSSPWYLTGRLGQADADLGRGAELHGWRVDDRDSAASLELGYSLHRNLGLQVGYHDLGTHVGLPEPCRAEICPLNVIAPAVLVAPIEVELDGFSLSAVPRWPLNERVSLYGKLGVLDWDADVAPGPGGGPRGFSGRDLLAGVGIAYAFAGGFGVLVEYESSDVLEAVSVGASWRF